MKHITFLFIIFSNVLVNGQTPPVDSIRNHISSNTLNRSKITVRPHNKDKFQLSLIESFDVLVKYLDSSFTGSFHMDLRLPEGFAPETGSLLMSFKDGIPHGKWSIFVQSPYSLCYEGYFKNGIKDSAWTYSGGSANGDDYFFSGKYQNGKKEGLWKGYNDAAGGSSDKVMYKNGKKNGTAIAEWYCCDMGSMSSGEYLQYVETSIFNKDTLLQFTSQEFYKNGNKKNEGHYSFPENYFKTMNRHSNVPVAFGVKKGRVGLWKFWDEEGKLIKEEVIKTTDQ